MKIPNIKIKPPGPKARAIVEKDQRYTAPAYVVFTLWSSKREEV